MEIIYFCILSTILNTEHRKEIPLGARITILNDPPLSDRVLSSISDEQWNHRVHITIRKSYLGFHTRVTCSKIMNKTHLLQNSGQRPQVIIQFRIFLLKQLKH
jgi:hypothetical protein